MSIPIERLHALSAEFDSLVLRLNESHNLSTEERRMKLRRMRELMIEIDTLILSNLEKDKIIVTSPDRATVKS
jgi:hypothetical protein